MKFKKIISAALCITLTIPMLTSCGKAVPSTYTDSSGKNLKDSDKSVSAFLTLAKEQTLNIIADIYDCSEEKAERELSHDGFTIKTTLDSNINSSVFSALESVADCDRAAALTDNNGAVLALYSSAGQKNFALSPTRPCSALKPLSVYAPAIESGKAMWSSVQLDDAVKQVIAESGGVYDWPTNANNRYSRELMGLPQAIRESCNTVAVKWLLELGVGESMSFLSEKLHIPLDRELQMSALSGNDEILGNLALGYLLDGVSVLDMAGYYQIFAKSGVYIKPFTVLSITDKTGKEIYSAKITSDKVLSEESAFIMNRLLKTPLQRGGTATDAEVKGVDICGKTGTSSDGEDNWFVGITPDYSCAVWHNSIVGDRNKNISPELFAEIIGGLKIKKQAYPECGSVVQKAYCAESGMLLSSNCRRMEIGYFSEGSVPQKCDKH